MFIKTSDSTHRMKGSKKDKVYSSIRGFFSKHPLIKFSAIFVLIIAYGLYAARSHGLKNGFLISFLSWSFFVLCTPVADAGILIDLPMRLITGIKMLYSEMMVWTIAISLNIFVHTYDRTLYQKTILLSLFKHIIDNPFPYWLIILLSALGTYLSVYVADKLVNPKIKKKKHLEFLNKYKIHIFVFIFLIVLVIYDFLLNNLGVKIPLI